VELVIPVGAGVEDAVVLDVVDSVTPVGITLPPPPPGTDVDDVELVIEDGGGGGLLIALLMKLNALTIWPGTNAMIIYIIIII
jgi:hypothetical protein